MAEPLVSLSVFIASPSGLEDVRRRFREVVEEYDQAEARPRGFTIVPRGWEDTLGGMGRPQALINKEVASSDYFVMILHDRWGQPTGDQSYDSGTFEEFQVAKTHLGSTTSPMRDIVLWFRGVDERQLSDPGPQLRKVLKFRREIERRKELLFHVFDEVEEFGRVLRRLLAKWIRDYENDAESDANEAPPPGPRPKHALAPLEPLEGVAIGVLNAEQLEARGLVSGAERSFAMAVVANPSGSTLKRYADFLFRRGRVTRSTQVAEQAYLHRPFDAGAGLRSRKEGSSALPVDLHNALSGAEETGDLEQLAVVLARVGAFRTDQYDGYGAIEALSREAGIWSGLRRRTNVADAIYRIGRAHHVLGRVDAASEHLIEARSRFQGEQDLSGAGRASLALAEVELERGAIEKAFEAALDAQSAFEGAGDQAGTADTIACLARLSLAVGLVDDAERHAKLALSLDELTNREVGAALDKIILAEVEVRRRRPAAAVALISSALETLSRVNDYRNIGQCHVLLARIAVPQDRSRAERELRLAYEAFEKAHWQKGLSEVARYLGELKGARAYAEKFLGTKG